MGERKIRVARLARETGLARSTIDGLYYGRVKRVDMDTLDRLCRYFTVPLSAILEWEATDG
jgi:putative transcriptional regulator